MNKVLPILFNTDMVRAILDGRKTVTRRIVKPQPPDTTHIQCTKGNCTWGFWEDGEKHFIKEPYDIGDILYVRESVFQGVGHYLDVSGETVSVLTQNFEYYADGLHEKDHWKDKYERTWMHRRPSIHMPKEAARIFLKVKDVHVEKLQGMSEDDALKEGIHYDNCPSGFTWKQRTSMVDCYTSALGAFGHLWNTTIKSEDREYCNWEANPWVWVIEFERCEKPEKW